jgi:hypothetical protein
MRWSTSGLQGWLRTAGGGAASFETELDGDLVLTAVGGGDAGGLRLVARFEAIRRVELKAFGAPFVTTGDDEARRLGAERGVLEIGDDGRARAAAFTGSESSLFASLLRGLWHSLGSTAPPAPDARSWTATEPGPSGRAAVQYQSDERGRRITRIRRRYESWWALPPQLVASDPGSDIEPRLDSTSSFTFAADGALERLTDRERFSFGAPGGAQIRASAELDLSLRERRQSSAGLPPTGRWGPLEATVAALAFERRLLEQRVQGLTFERLEEGLTIFQGSGYLPERQRWVGRATGLLQLEPELAARLLPRALSGWTRPRTRALIFDLWVSAGTARAQGAMRTALATPGLPEREQASLLSRLGFLQEPTLETVRFVREFVDRAGERAGPRAAAIAVLGSLVRRLAGARPEVAREHHARLVAGLGASTASEDRVVWLIGLGNAGVEGDEPVMRSHADDPSPAVRRQVAWSLRNYPSPEARRILLDLLGRSPEADVQVAALLRIATHPLDDDGLASLERFVRSGALASVAAIHLVDVVSGRPSPRARAVLMAMAALPNLSTNARNRVVRALSR